MGMDVYGNAPSSPVGEYFRANVWHWRPLWDYVCAVGELPKRLHDAGHMNDGAGPNAKQAAALAKRLREEISTGRTAKYVAKRDKGLAALQPEPCDICGATGSRAEPPRLGPGPVPCNACGPGCQDHVPGKVGHRKPIESHYPLDVQTVEEFAAFCEASGGFRIL